MTARTSSQGFLSRQFIKLASHKDTFSLLHTISCTTASFRGKLEDYHHIYIHKYTYVIHTQSNTIQIYISSEQTQHNLIFKPGQIAGVALIDPSYHTTRQSSETVKAVNRHSYISNIRAVELPDWNPLCGNISSQAQLFLTSYPSQNQHTKARPHVKMKTRSSVAREIRIWHSKGVSACQAMEKRAQWPRSRCMDEA
jgi:hypothetical protein